MEMHPYLISTARRRGKTIGIIEKSKGIEDVKWTKVNFQYIVWSRYPTLTGTNEWQNQLRLGATTDEAIYIIDETCRQCTVRPRPSGDSVTRCDAMAVDGGLTGVPTTCCGGNNQRGAGVTARQQVKLSMQYNGGSLGPCRSTDFITLAEKYSGGGRLSAVATTGKGRWGIVGQLCKNTNDRDLPQPRNRPVEVRVSTSPGINNIRSASSWRIFLRDYYLICNKIRDELVCQNNVRK